MSASTQLNEERRQTEIKTKAGISHLLMTAGDSDTENVQSYWGSNNENKVNSEIHFYLYNYKKFQHKSKTKKQQVTNVI